MRIFIVTGLFLFHVIGHCQEFSKESALNLDDRISTIDFVEIIDGNIEEALYYYNNNWKVLRQRAQAKNYILSYQLLQTPLTDDSKIQLLLITTYANKNQYEKREKHFQELIENRGGLKLLNKRKPNEFRKIAFGKELVKHLN